MFHGQVPLPGVRKQRVWRTAALRRSRTAQAGGSRPIQRTHHRAGVNRVRCVVREDEERTHALTLEELTESKVNRSCGVTEGIPRETEARCEQVMILVDQVLVWTFSGHAVGAAERFVRSGTGIRARNDPHTVTSIGSRLRRVIEERLE